VGAYPGTEPVWWSGPSCEPRQLVVGGEPQTSPLFWALPPGGGTHAGHVPLYAVDQGSNEPQYTVEDPGAGEPVAVVWRNPMAVALPVADYLPALRADAGADQCLPVGGVLALPEPGDAPAGGSARWELDGVAVEGPQASPSEGLHMLARVLVRADGLVVRDEAIVRVGAADEPGLDESAGGGEGGSSGEPGTGTGASAGAGEPGGGCGCRSAGPQRTAAWMGLPLLVLMQRRRRRAPTRVPRSITFFPDTVA
jgi:hypothetical protein